MKLLKRKNYGHDLIGKAVISVGLKEAEYRGRVIEVVKDIHPSVDTIRFDRGGGLHRHYCAFEGTPEFEKVKNLVTA